jgi:RNA polymerase sigma-70 factor (ECF subfamily)
MISRMAKTGKRTPATKRLRATARRTATLLSDKPTIELVVQARDGNQLALEALLQRSLPRLKRWARGRLPPAARGLIDTEDLVQDAAIHAVARLDQFEPRHVGALQAYLRRSVINRIRDEIRRVGRRPVAEDLSENLASSDASPLELAIRKESYARYRAALEQLRPRDRELVVARLEAQWTLAELRQQFGFNSAAAARMALTRALNRLIALLKKL